MSLNETRSSCDLVAWTAFLYPSGESLDRFSKALQDSLAESTARSQALEFLRSTLKTRVEDATLALHRLVLTHDELTAMQATLMIPPRFPSETE